jgi:hypothetical protein
MKILKSNPKCEKTEEPRHIEILKIPTGHQWLTPAILATQEADIMRISVQRQPRELVHEILSQKKPITKKKVGGVSQAVGPEFKPQYCTEKKKF